MNLRPKRACEKTFELASETVIDMSHLYFEKDLENQLTAADNAHRKTQITSLSHK